MTEEAKPLPTSGTEKVCPLLDETTVARIRAKEAEANARAEAATEARTEKYNKAKSLKWELRLEELRAIPKNNRTPDQQREFARLYQKSRRAASTSQPAELSKIATAEEFWASNRLAADPMKIAKWRKTEQIVLDQLHWMNSGWECAPQDPCFVSLEDGLELLDDFAEKHGLISDDPISYKHQTLRDFQPSWGVWATTTVRDPIWGTVEGFWKDPEVFRAMSEESEATAVYAKFGIQTGIPAYHLRLFKDRVAAHKCSGNSGERQSHLKYDADKCWLCRFERLYGPPL